MALAVDIALLVVMLFVILAGAALFTNAVEWFGHRLGVDEGVTGSIFAAVGTTLPETVIPLVAVVAGLGQAGEEVAVGAILGAPFILSTLAMVVTALGILIQAARGRRGTGFVLNEDVIGRDLLFFAGVYVIAIGAAFVDPRGWKIVISFALLGLYALYVWLHVRASEGTYTTSAELSGLWLTRSAREPRMAAVVAQLAIALIVIVVGARVFVQSVSNVAEAIGMPTIILALFVVPLASELPEKFNSVIWVFQRKDTLAMGNISGAMVWQSSIVPVIGIMLTDWTLDGSSSTAFVSAGVALVAASLIGLSMKLQKDLPAWWVLLVGGIGYFGYLAYAIIATT